MIVIGLLKDFYIHEAVEVLCGFVVTLLVQMQYETMFCSKSGLPCMLIFYYF